MTISSDLKNLVSDIKQHFQHLSATKEADYSAYHQASSEAGNTAKQTLKDTWQATKDFFSADHDASAADKAARKEEKQTEKDFGVFLKDLDKVAALRAKLAAAEAKAQEHLNVLNSDGERLMNASQASDDASAKAQEAWDNLASTVTNGAQDVKDASAAAKAAKAAGAAAYAGHKAEENAAFRTQFGNDANQLGHDAKVAAKIGGIRAGTGATIAAEVLSDIAIGVHAPYALPAAVVPQIYASKQLVTSANKKVADIRAAEAQHNQTPGAGSNSTEKAA